MGLLETAWELIELPLRGAIDAAIKPAPRKLDARLEAAIKNDLISTVRYLLEKGANPNSGCGLFDAVQNKNTAIVRALADHGANINRAYTTVYENGIRKKVVLHNPLIIAIRQGNTSLVSLLIEHQADLHAEEVTSVTQHGSSQTDVTKKSAWEIAQEGGNENVIALLADKLPPSIVRPSSTLDAAPAASDAFNAFAEPVVETDSDIVISGTLKFKQKTPAA